MQKLTTFLTTKLEYGMSVRLYVTFIAGALLFEHFQYLKSFIKTECIDYLIALFLGCATFIYIAIRGIDRWLSIFILFISFIIFSEFRSSANHSILPILILLPLAFFPNKASSQAYSEYVGKMFGIVMIVAATQKLISGNYLNGHFLKFLASLGDLNRSMLSATCLGEPLATCDPLTFLSILAVAWQYMIGILLLINCRHILALIAELIFCIVLGIVTNEMNFQTLNVAALLIIFRIRAYPIIFVILSAFLIIDLISINTIFEAFYP